MGRDEACWIESGHSISASLARLDGPHLLTGWNARAARKQKMTEKHSRKMAQGTLTLASWNQVSSWLRHVDRLQRAA
jgi:hypothetical protein